MRVRYLVVLLAVMCVMAFGLLHGEAQSNVRVRHVPKSKLGLYDKSTGGFSYNAKLNRWETIVPDKHPVIIKPELIGPEKVPAYYSGGNEMAEDCWYSYTIITDQSYAIVISTNCSGDSDGRLRRYGKSYSLPKGVQAVRAKEEKGWEEIGRISAPPNSELATSGLSGIVNNP